LYLEGQKKPPIHASDFILQKNVPTHYDAYTTSTFSLKSIAGATGACAAASTAAPIAIGFLSFTSWMGLFEVTKIGKDGFTMAV
jgi:hypothetical protein